MIIGIDPGLTGAIAFLNDDGRFYSVKDIPIFASGKNRKVKKEISAPS